jgi:hypothetical protein
MSILKTKELHQTSIHSLQYISHIQSLTNIAFDPFELERLSGLCFLSVASYCALVLSFQSLSHLHSHTCKASKRHLSVWWSLWSLSDPRDWEEHSTGLSDHLREGKGWKRHVLTLLLNGGIGSSEPNLRKQIVYVCCVWSSIMIYFFLSPFSSSLACEWFYII